MVSLVRDAVSCGRKPVAVYGCGEPTRRAHRLFEMKLPIVGLLDDEPRMDELFGLPVVCTSDAIQELGVDTVLISSDAWEPAMWRRTSELRRSGVEVLTVYGCHDDDERSAIA